LTNHQKKQAKKQKKTIKNKRQSEREKEKFFLENTKKWLKGVLTKGKKRKVEYTCKEQKKE